MHHNFSSFHEKGCLSGPGGKKVRTPLFGKVMVQSVPVLPLKCLGALKRYSSNGKFNASNDKNAKNRSSCFRQKMVTMHHSMKTNDANCLLKDSSETSSTKMRLAGKLRPGASLSAWNCTTLQVVCAAVAQYRQLECSEECLLQREASYLLDH
jgi:hypothetical protein